MTTNDFAPAAVVAAPATEAPATAAVIGAVAAVIGAVAAARFAHEFENSQLVDRCLQDAIGKLGALTGDTGDEIVNDLKALLREAIQTRDLARVRKYLESEVLKCWCGETSGVIRGHCCPLCDSPFRLSVREQREL